MAHGKPSKSANDASPSEEDLPPPPDGGWGWVVVFASFMIHVIADGITNSFGIFYVKFLEVFKEGNAKTAWIASILVGVTLGSGPISSAFVMRYGCRIVTMAGGLLAGICLVVSMFAQDVITLLFTIGIGTGLGFGLIYLPAIVSVTMYFERYRSLATGIAVCGAGFGTIVFPPLTEILMQEYGWRGTTLLMGGFVLNCIFFGALFRPLEYPKKEPIEAFPAKKKFEIPRSNSAGHSMDSRKTETMRLAQSQPSSLDSIHSKKASVSAFHRKDVFYQGSLIKLAERQSRSTIPDELKLLDKSGSFIRENLRRPSSISRHMMVQETRRKKLCADVDIETIKEMMNYALFKDPVFIIFLLSNFATSVGYQVPYVYIVPQSNLIGLTGDQGSYLLSVLGIANTVGRIVLGYLSDKAWVNRLLVYEMCLIVSGLATALTTLCFNFTTMALCASVYGFSIGAYVGLTSVILVDLLGLDKLTNAFGLLLLFQGIASLIGPPLIGFIFDITQSYQGGFFLAGGCIAASGAVLFLIPPLQRMQEKKEKKLHALELAGHL